jgi:hypothetical protein
LIPWALGAALTGQPASCVAHLDEGPAVSPRPAGALGALGYRHDLHARRLGRDGQAIQLDIAAVADAATWQRARDPARRVDEWLLR